MEDNATNIHPHLYPSPIRLLSNTTHTMNTSQAMAMSMLRNAAVPPAAIASPKNAIGLRMLPPSAIHWKACGQVSTSATTPARMKKAWRILVDADIGKLLRLDRRSRRLPHHRPAALAPPGRG